MVSVLRNSKRNISKREKENDPFWKYFSNLNTYVEILEKFGMFKAIRANRFKIYEE